MSALTPSLYLITALIVFGILIAVLTAITSSVQTEIYTSIYTLINYSNYLRGVLPVDNILLAISTYLIFLSGFYTFKISLWLYSLLPIFGQKNKTSNPASGGGIE